MATFYIFHVHALLSLPENHQSIDNWALQPWIEPCVLTVSFKLSETGPPGHTTQINTDMAPNIENHPHTGIDIAEQEHRSYCCTGAAKGMDNGLNSDAQMLRC